MRIAHLTFLAAVLAVPAATAANAAPTKLPKASYAQLSRSAEASPARVTVRQRAAAETVPARPCTNITCPGFILLGVGY